MDVVTGATESVGVQRSEYQILANKVKSASSRLFAGTCWPQKHRHIVRKRHAFASYTDIAARELDSVRDGVACYNPVK